MAAGSREAQGIIAICASAAPARVKNVWRISRPCTLSSAPPITMMADLVGWGILGSIGLDSNCSMTSLVIRRRGDRLFYDL